MHTIPSILQAGLAALDISPTEYAAKLGHKSNGLVALVLGDKRKIPVEKVAEWANTLELSDADAKELKELVELSHSPLGVRHRVSRLEATNRELFRVSCSMASRVYPQATDSEIEDLFKKIHHPVLFRDAWIRLAERYPSK